MYWQDESEQHEFLVPDDVVDLVYAIGCRTLPVDHAFALSEAIKRALPWFAHEPLAGMHTIHGAESGNGWARPEAAEATLYLSRRTRLALRLPRHRLDDAAALTGQQLDVAGNAVEVGAAHRRLLSASTTLYARYVTWGGEQDEDDFLRQCASELKASGIRAKKILCGKAHAVQTGGGTLLTRSLMAADLSLDDAIRLQEIGLGEHRKMGCGLFVAHKSA